MVHTAQQLLVLATQYEDLANRALIAVAEGECNCENSHCPHGEEACHNKAGKRKAMHVGALCDGCADRMPEKYMKKDAAKDKKKLDPKAKVRNRGTVCVPASSAKDKKDHFPINSEPQARNALARVHQYSAAPPWYNGSLKSLQELVSRKVHSKYKGIGKSDKKSSSLDIRETVLNKYAQNAAIPEVNVEDLPQAPVPVESLPKAPKYPAISPDVQRALNQALHLNLRPDGQLGPETQAALEQFKAKYSKVYSLIG